MSVLAAITETQIVVGVVVAVVGLAIQVAVLLERHLRLMGRRFDEARDHTDESFGKAREHTDALRDHVDAGFREAREHTDALRDHVDAGFREAREHTEACFKEAREQTNELRGDVHRIDKGLVKLNTTVRNLLLRPADPLPDDPEDGEEDESDSNTTNLHRL